MDKKNKVVAALLAFFLGGFGAHKFYLGQQGWGIVYLIFCWTLVPTLAAFVETFMLLGTSDAKFDQRFNLDALPSSSAVLTSALGIEKLAELQRKGLITEEEFEAKRRKLLERM